MSVASGGLLTALAVGIAYTVVMTGGLRSFPHILTPCGGEGFGRLAGLPSVSIIGTLAAALLVLRLHHAHNRLSSGVRFLGSAILAGALGGTSTPDSPLRAVGAGTTVPNRRSAPGLCYGYLGCAFVPASSQRTRSGGCAYSSGERAGASHGSGVYRHHGCCELSPLVCGAGAGEYPAQTRPGRRICRPSHSRAAPHISRLGDSRSVQRLRLFWLSCPLPASRRGLKKLGEAAPATDPQCQP